METLFTVIRVAPHLAEGCFGVLLHKGEPFAVTLERTFDDLKPVIPVGIWPCTRTVYEHGGYDTYEIHIPGHSRVLFHKGNVETDSKACILVGESYAVFNTVEGIADAAHGFAEFMQLADRVPTFNLSVEEIT